MCRILLIDDEEHIRQFYTEELSDQGHQVSTLASGYGLLSKIDNIEPDAVLLDIKLVDYNGLDLLQEIRRGDRVTSEARSIPGPPGTPWPLGTPPGPCTVAPPKVGPDLAP